MTELTAFFDSVRPALERTLETLLPPENTAPARIHRAMRYSTLNGGKRVRPCLCVAGFEAFQKDWRLVLPVACAVEMIHCYSLIHDDLPAMDDDDFRRGRPSCHKEFDEAIAILAGDGLLTLAFETLGRVESFPPAKILQVVSMLGRAAGTSTGMIAGQVLDLEAEGTGDISAEQLNTIHRSKTGALIGAAVWIGAFLGGASEPEMESIRTYCDRIGLAFQVIDDILDASDGSNRDEGKATFPGFYGIDRSRSIAHELMQEARAALHPLGGRAGLLVEFCDYLESRTT